MQDQHLGEGILLCRRGRLLRAADAARQAPAGRTCTWLLCGGGAQGRQGFDPACSQHTDSARPGERCQSSSYMHAAYLRSKHQRRLAPCDGGLACRSADAPSPAASHLRPCAWALRERGRCWLQLLKAREEDSKSNTVHGALTKALQHAAQPASRNAAGAHTLRLLSACLEACCSQSTQDRLTCSQLPQALLGVSCSSLRAG